MKKHYVVFIILMGLLPASAVFGQDSYQTFFEYLSPRPGARFVMPDQSIGFRLNNPTNQQDLENIQVHLTGSQSGRISGRLSLSTDQKTLLYYPDKAFSPGEEVQVVFRFPPSLGLPDYRLSFFTSSITPQKRLEVLTEIRQDVLEEHKAVDPGAWTFQPPVVKGTVNDTLPAGFPEISITHWNDPSEGYIFVSPMDYDQNTYFEIILDNYATPVYYHEIPPYGAQDFKLQPNGLLTAYSSPLWSYLVYDSNFDLIDTIEGGNGYQADLHELRYYENMHSFLLCYDPQLVDMSEIVEGGQEDAVVTGLIVQELDAEKNVVFQWRSWDHYEITDALDWIDLTAESIDYVHGNSIEVNNADEMMICSRNMNEITKIDRNTGEIIWRLNGKNNMFEFIEPGDSFCVQHSIRLMPDSTNISVFDNGGCWSPQVSSAVEYSLDEENFICTQVERLYGDPDIFGAFMGNTQRMMNGHTINGWGKGIPSVTEYDTNGDIVLEFSFPLLNYRAFKFDWEHTVFTTSVSSIDFGEVHYLDSATTTFEVTNTYDKEIRINRIVNRKEVFSVTTPLPQILAPGASASFEVKFVPGNSEAFVDDLTVCWEIHSDTLNRRIAKQIHLTGSATGNEGVNDLQSGGFTVFPNPHRELIRIESERFFMERVDIFSMEGQKLRTFGNLKTKRLQLPSALPSGTYILRIRTEDGKYFSGKITRE